MQYDGGGGGVKILKDRYEDFWTHSKKIHIKKKLTENLKQERNKDQ